VKVIAVGDTGQLTSVQAGGWFAALTREHAGPELREVIRQHDPAQRDALAACTTPMPTDTWSTRRRTSRSTRAGSSPAANTVHSTSTTARSPPSPALTVTAA
jgi:hypothetical protein